MHVDCGFVNAIVFLDLKKAFDTVNYAILLSILEAYGIRDSANQWFCSYLRNHMQTCLVNFLLIPAGNDFGASFVFTINDLPNRLIHSQPRMYADDTSICYVSNDVEEIEHCVHIDLDTNSPDDHRIKIFKLN